MAALTSVLLAASAVAGGVMNYSNSQKQAQATKAQAAFQQQQAESNARLAELDALDAEARGDITTARTGLAYKGMVGDQRAEFAAQGIDVGSGSASDLQADTENMGNLAVLKAHSNAWRQAFGYKVQAQNATQQGQFYQRAQENASNDTLLTGGLEFARSGMQAGYDLLR